MISIIIPVYNVEKYLRECLDSLLNQTYQDFEVICVDDGSTDESYKILEEYKNKDERFIIIQQDNQGAGPARNRGIEVAKGDYIQFLDADDYFESNMLEKLYSEAKENNADMVVCSARKVDENNNIIESGNPLWPINLDKIEFDKVFSPEDYSEDIFGLFCVVPWNKLYKRSLILDNGLKFQNLSSSNDVAFGHISRICAKRIVVIKDELINYRFNREGSIAKVRANSCENILKAADYVKKFLKSKGIYSNYKASFIKGFKNHIRSGISLCNNDQYLKLIQDCKNIMPDEWDEFKPVFQKTYITSEYLKNIIGCKKTLLWGASIFIRGVLESEKEKNPNIIGIVDRNKSLWGKQVGSYTVYSPDMIRELNPDAVLLTVLSNNEDIYKDLKCFFAQNYPNIELLPNIFLDENEKKVELDIEFVNVLPEETLEKDKIHNLGFTFIKSTDEEIFAYNKLGEDYKQYSEMSDQDRLFLITLVNRFKPKKILELGVSKGGSSYLILNMIKNNPDTHLYSIDYNEWHYRIKDKKTGFLLDSYPELKKQWTLKTGGMALNFLDEISSSEKEEEKFDFCFIDTVHSIPGEILDLLQVLPYLKKNAVVCFHDTNLQMNGGIRKNYCVNNLIMSSLSGEKLLPYYKPFKSVFGNYFVNIGAVKLDDNVNIFGLFNLLTLSWNSIPSLSDINLLKQHLCKYYHQYYINYFENIVNRQEILK